MIYLALSVLTATSMILILRGFLSFRINSLQAIVFNYYFCLLLGILYTPFNQLIKIPNWSGFPLSILLGCFFIFIFYAIAKTAQLFGVTVTSVAQKLSFILPAFIGILFFDETANYKKYIGFTLAFVSVFLISSSFGRKEAKVSLHENIAIDPPSKSRFAFLLPFIVFFGSGCSDIVVKIIETKHLGVVQISAFTVIIFGAASIVGSIWMLRELKLGIAKFETKSIYAGIILGIPNYGSIYFLVLALQKSGLESSQAFPINNVSIILVSALSAWLIFKEKLYPIQIIGLLTAVITILILI